MGREKNKGKVKVVFCVFVTEKHKIIFFCFYFLKNEMKFCTRHKFFQEISIQCFLRKHNDTQQEVVYNIEMPHII